MLRKRELLNLKRSDIDIDSRIITVTGKGRKQRLVPVSPKTIKGFHLFQAKFLNKMIEKYKKRICNHQLVHFRLSTQIMVLEYENSRTVLKI